MERAKMEFTEKVNLVLLYYMIVESIGSYLVAAVGRKSLTYLLKPEVCSHFPFI